MDTWSGKAEFRKEDTVKVEDSFVYNGHELFMYEYFNTLGWCYNIVIVLDDIIIDDGNDHGLMCDSFRVAKDVVRVISQ